MFIIRISDTLLPQDLTLCHGKLSAAKTKARPQNWANLLHQPMWHLKDMKRLVACLLPA
jgi:hypothetical protein